MTTFERRLIKDESAWKEPKNAYYKLYEDPEVCKALLAEFGLQGEHCHIINGHIPVKAGKGESPIKGGGKLIVIDGGFCKAYQHTSGIAGYTLIYDSYAREGNWVAGGQGEQRFHCKIFLCFFNSEPRDWSPIQ